MPWCRRPLLNRWLVTCAFEGASGRLDRPDEAMDVALGQLLPARFGVPRSFCIVVRVHANKKPLMCGLGVPVGCRMKHAKRMFKRCGLGAALLPARFGVPRSFCTVCRVLRVLRVFKRFKILSV